MCRPVKADGYNSVTSVLSTISKLKKKCHRASSVCIALKLSKFK